MLVGAIVRVLKFDGDVVLKLLLHESQVMLVKCLKIIIVVANYFCIIWFKRSEWADVQGQNQRQA